MVMERNGGNHGKVEGRGVGERKTPTRSEMSMTTSFLGRTGMIRLLLGV